ncbi:unnamed protein product [Mycena citricolor]|uniref:Uncharacterized protein n=1 Tax=Mycena citricolor TaxID=2018698 RepID=A0AAD2JY04_9AGAR|nr:unnamed protein product [Mycena citricolor]CAK5273369.1 unnamed protein product [Mycena citricolor]
MFDCGSSMEHPTKFLNSSTILIFLCLIASVSDIIESRLYCRPDRIQLLGLWFSVYPSFKVMFVRRSRFYLNIA